MHVLAIAVHPGAETLGCGGTLFRHAAAGDVIHWLIVTATTAPDFSSERIATQERQIAAVTEAYGFASTRWLRFPSTRLETVPKNTLIGAMRDAVAEVHPEVIYMPNRSDVHSDHRVVFETCMSVLKSFAMSSLGVRRILACEVPSETDCGPAVAEGAFVPSTFIDVSATLRRKLRIMDEVFETEQQGKFMPRGGSALEALARHRGATIGVEFAEAFALMREIV